MQSGLKADLWEKDTTLGTLTTIATTQTSSPSTLISKPYSGDSPTKKMTISSLKDLHQSDTDSVSSTRKVPQTEAVGVPLTELQMKKKSLIQASNLEVTQEGTPQIQTSQSPSMKLPKKKNPNSQPSPNLSLPISVNHLSNLTHWLEQWHRLQTPLPSPQTVWWPEPWELEYPEEECPPVLKESSNHYSPHNTVEEMEVEMILLNLTDEILEMPGKRGWRWWRWR